MSLLSKLEQKLEATVEGIFARAFRGRVQPLEIARKIEKTMDAKKILSVSTAYAPNRFTVTLNPEDYDQLASFAPTFIPELERYVADYAKEIGCQLTDEPKVELCSDTSVKAGVFRVEAEIADVPRQLERKVKRRKARRTRYLFVVHKGIDVNRTFEVEDTTAVIGRGSDCQISLSDPSASRHHARLTIADNGTVVVEDLHSTNGTFVNDQAIVEQDLQPGDRLGIGSTVLEFKVVHAV